MKVNILMTLMTFGLSFQAFAQQNWRVPNFPNPDAKEYRLRGRPGCNLSPLFYQMKSDVDKILPDKAGVYNFGLAVDTTSSMENNIALVAQWLDHIYSSVPPKAMVAFAVVDYADGFREGFVFSGDKNYSLSRVKNFLLSRRIYGGGDTSEGVFGGSYQASFHLKRQHGLIFNITNATGDNTKVKQGGSKRSYTLRDLNNLAVTNIHVIRNVYLSCQ